MLAGLLAVAAFTVTDLRAEVTVIRDSSGGLIGTLQMFEIGTGGGNIWSPVRTSADPALLLNPDGDLYGDGPPSVVMNPVSHMPEAVWSYWDGTHFQIAWSRFDGTAWSMVQTAAGPDFEYLTSGDRQNFDPKFWIDGAGNRRVAWWRDSLASVDEVVVAVLPAGETQWWTPQRISTDGVPARRPDIRTFSRFGTFIVAEESNAGALSAVVYDSPLLTGHTPQRGSDPWGRTVVLNTSTVRPLSAAIYSVTSSGGSVPLIAWRVDSLLATSLFDEESLTWSSPVYVTFPEEN